MEPVVVFRTFDLAEAQVIRSQLMDAGLNAELLNENSAAIFDVATGGVRVVVPPGEADEARALIDAKKD